MTYLPFILLLTPLIASVWIALFFSKHKELAAAFSVTACALSFLCASLIFTADANTTYASIQWLNLPGLKVHIGSITDHLAKLMLLVVTGVGLMIHIFSLGYMDKDEGKARFFAKLSFFMFSMLGIVLADNLVMMFIFWELVGLSSYLLIGFWYQRPAAADAAKKAFIVNRIGDFGFMIGILSVWGIWQTVQFQELEHVSKIFISSPWVHIAAFGLFCGCIGKSAQFPLHVWLPDAMEGPTPVSALIHAATMVAAGVYMLCRVAFLIQLSPMTMTVIAWIGGFTALLAALIATQQNDIKRILAYSTLSQLGCMVMVVGVGAYTAAMFHLSTHAFFKALLFLGAGSVIHALHHEQNIWNMGGLWKRMKFTSLTFLIGAAALAGVPLLSGFFSKESILLSVYQAHRPFFFMGLIVAALTPFYMTRLFMVAFWNRSRGKHASHAEESPNIMVGPLVVLSVLSVVGGYFGIENYLSHHPIVHHNQDSNIVMLSSMFALLLGAGSAWMIYRKETSVDPIQLRLLQNKFYFDEIYNRTVVYAQDRLAQFSAWWDRWIIEGVFIRGTAITGAVLGEIFRLFQGGNLKAYAVIFILGVLLLFYRIMLGGML